MPLTHSGTILVCGLEQIGCTIATGLCKSGDVKKIYLYDKETVTNEDVETMTELLNTIGSSIKLNKKKK